MNKYQKALVEEHSNLFIKLEKLNDYVYSSDSDKDNRVEFANKCIQLKGMRMYAEALEARLANAGIYFEDGDYIVRIATIVPPSTENKSGSDFDVDAEEK